MKIIIIWNITGTLQTTLTNYDLLHMSFDLQLSFKLSSLHESEIAVDELKIWTRCPFPAFISGYKMQGRVWTTRPYKTSKLLLLNPSNTSFCNNFFFCASQCLWTTNFDKFNYLKGENKVLFVFPTHHHQHHHPVFTISNPRLFSIESSNIYN